VKAIVVGGGELVLSARVLAAAASAELVIAADSGLRHLAALGRNADVAVGDFDSHPRPDDGDGAEIIVHPVAKDDTDLALALREAVQRGADRVTLLAALRGARLDHGAANLLLLSAHEFRHCDLRAVDGDDELRVVRSSASLDGRAGDLVTLLALTARCSGVTTQGLTYPLAAATLYRGSTRGVSNVLAAANGAVSLKAGVLLLVHRHGGDPNAL
jgi:thiamine pyrophosphokinase